MDSQQEILNKMYQSLLVPYLTQTANQSAEYVLGTGLSISYVLTYVILRTTLT